MYLLEIEPLDIGEDVRAMGLELTEADENREPIRGADAAKVWARLRRAGAGEESWLLDFFSHLDPIRDYCTRHEIPFREASKRSLVVPASALTPEKLEALIDRFQKETFGVRAGALAAGGESPLGGVLDPQGVDAYHGEYQNYYFCAIFSFDDGSLVILSE